MAERVLIESIKTDRQLSPEDNLDELAASLRDKGQKVPVLLLEGNILVDGLRRLTALQMLGHATVQVVVAATLDRAVEVLAKASKTQPMAYRRTWEIRVQLDELVVQRLADNRAKRVGLKQGQSLPEGRSEQSRYLWARAFNEVHLDNKIWPVYRAGREDLIRAVEEGHLTPSGALRMMGDSRPLQGNVHDRGGQTRILKGATRTLSGTIKALEKLGWPLDVDPEEMEPTLAELKRYRRVLYRVVRLLEEAVSK